MAATESSKRASTEASGSKAKKAKTDAPPAGAFFAPRSTKKVEEDDQDEEMDEASNAEDEEAEESEDEEESQQAAGKIADIFTKGASSNVTKVTWKAGDPVPYAALVEVFDQISKTTKRLEISSILTSFLVKVIQLTPDDLIKVVYLCINRLAPDYEGIELGIGDSLLVKAICNSTGRKKDAVDADYKKIGDLGEVAEASKSKQPTLFKSKALTVPGVFKILKEIAMTSGNKSQDKKIGLINKLLAACEGSETRYIIRSLAGKLRISLAERSVVLSLAHAATKAEIDKAGKKYSKEKTAAELEKGAEIVKAVFAELPSYDLIIPAILEHGVAELKDRCKLTPGLPLKPMLAKPTKAISEVLDRFEGKNFTCEYKYDGERAQIHLLSDGTVKVYSRNSENTSEKYPDIVAQFPKCVKANTKNCVIDAEAVAWDFETKKLLPFQQLMNRKRKNVKAEDVKVKVHLFAFDLLCLNDEPLVTKDLLERRRLLREHFEPVEDEFSFAISKDLTSVEDIQIFLDDSVKDSCEGLMVKILEGEGSSYEPSKRSIHWLKLKKDYLAGVGDTFDLVVVGADLGKGKRTNVYGNFLLATYDEETESYQAVCKIGTGFSEEVLKEAYDKLSPISSKEKKGQFDLGQVKMDVYFEPTYVWEVLAADLSLSPVYAAARGICDPAKGISLRFPRFIRWREDKGPEQSTDPEQIADAYRSQASAGGGGPKGKGKKGKAGDEDGGFY